MTGYAFTVVVEVTEITVLQSRQVDSVDVKLLPSYVGFRSTREDGATSVRSRVHSSDFLKSKRADEWFLHAVQVLFSSDF
jgi:hypothetical protein